MYKIMNDNKKRFLFSGITSVLSVAVVGIITVIVFKQLHIMPFGSKTLAVADGDLQYIDLFGYFKDVLSGKNSIAYSMGNMLGNNNIALYSYYLASPFSLLVIFFKKTQLFLFFNFLYLLKICMAALTCSVFLQVRFFKLKKYFVVLLSSAYALMQYNLWQASNIMWLDGVYMLPLILLGVYLLVNKNSSMLLVVSVGLSILFNWYTGGINCLFAIVWFFMEKSLCNIKRLDKYVSFKDDIVKLIQFGIAMALGVLLSMISFLPTVISLTKGKGTSDLNLFDNLFKGNPISIIQGYAIGVGNSNSSVSLFCGALVLIGFLGFFLVKNENIKNKIVLGIASVFLIMIYYWQPLFVIFCLFRDAKSYFFRYTYGTELFLIFVAAMFLAESFYKLKSKIIIFKIAVTFSIVLLVINYLKPLENNQNAYYTVFFIIVIAIVLCSLGLRKKLNGLAVSSLILLMSCELLTNMNITLNTNLNETQSFIEYIDNQEKQIEMLKKYDHSFYRIVQTSNREITNGISAIYNEAMNYNYASVSGYTSATDNRQLSFLDRLGYKTEDSTILIKNTSILATDSLFNTKYVLSPYYIEGLQKIDSLGEYNGKAVYKNPYALSTAFAYPGEMVEKFKDSSNPFEYTNEFYSNLIGEKVDLYKRLNVIKTNVENKQVYTIEKPTGNYALYGNLPTSSWLSGTLNLNNIASINYSCWLSQSVFYIPINSQADRQVSVEVTGDDLSKILDEQFYALDLDELKKISDEINSNSAKDINVNNGKVTGNIYSDKKQKLYISLPYDEGWHAEVNNQRVNISTLGDMMVLPLEKGKNTFKLSYVVPGLKLGKIVTFMTLIVVVLWGLYEVLLLKRREK